MTSEAPRPAQRDGGERNVAGYAQQAGVDEGNLRARADAKQVVRVAIAGCSCAREAERMVRLFLPHARVVCADEPALGATVDVETVDVETVDVETVDVDISLQARVSADGVVAAGFLRVAGVTYQARHHRAMPQTADDITLRRRSKQAVLHVLHQVLAAWLGRGQPWGILTGIRPLKVLHQMRRQGWDWTRIRTALADDYLIAPERIDLMVETAAAELAAVPDLDQLDREVSVYVGIPFCPTHCAYCTFPAYAMTEKAAYAEAFLSALCKEIDHAGRMLRAYGIPVTSVYVGGGTPTSLRAHELEMLLSALCEHIPGFGRWREFTVEAGRPDTISPDRLQVMRRFGVDRVSVNPQTYRRQTLRAIGRGHTPEMVDHRFLAARKAGFANINMDIILGLPGETVADVRHTLARIAALGPDAVTVHTLSFKRAAPVREAGVRDAVPDDATVRRMMDEAMAFLREHGYRPYYLYRQKDILGNLENVGLALPGKESVYNIAIMEERQTIIGIGGGAVTKLIGPGGKVCGRFANPREPRVYVETIDDVIRRKETVLRPVLAAIAAGRDPDGGLR
ncbi:oxygen-independent coproporphyrinogen-III oxidase-like protein HemZ [Alicyclobacillus cellulosilyticus]|uniref:Oxygen-independent coproporphyrinogen-III oxidase-like protein HemZ n=1 Tax=Alicyclobacillus cellulosilyticus TaxID=1003997 RepID=A0A917KGL0_9BACL|nr:coproporphyrinogen dehydrogenase HemZ [Alicyclobacillus cellulosilyticus]GGJ12487.1 oxygen-independent coproporphyrinogen-III oxidase-like protein HemZ [Alicyclobacillus cellulosilyticus]